MLGIKRLGHSAFCVHLIDPQLTVELSSRDFSQTKDAANAKTVPTTVPNCHAPDNPNTEINGLKSRAIDANIAAKPPRRAERAWHITAIAPEATIVFKTKPYGLAYIQKTA